VGIHFMVDEDKKLRLRTIGFVGNEEFSDRELRKNFRTKTWRFWSYATSWFDKSGTYSEPLFLQDLRSVEKIYSDAGFLQVEVGAPQVNASPDGIEVTVDVAEGPRFRVGALDFAGDDTANVEALRKLLLLKEGEIFNRSYLTQDVASLTEHYTNRGFFYASVEPLSNLAQGTQVVDVTFHVRKGPLYFIRQIDIAGNTTTVDPVIRREIPFVEGQLYSQRQIALARSRIERLGFFEEVDLRVEPTPDPEQLDVEVSVVERPTGSFSFGAGFSSQDNFLLNGSLSQTNLFGRGYAVNLSADVGRETQRFFVSVRDPSAFGTDFSLGLTVFRTRLRFESFDQDATGADVVLGHALTEDHRSFGFLRYSFSSAEVDKSINVNAASLILREVFQNETTSSLVGLSFTTDRRNDRIAPTDGYTLGGGLDFSGLGFFSKFLRSEARFARYIPAPRWLFEQSTFVTSARMGWALPFNTIADFDFPGLSIDDGLGLANCNDVDLQCKPLDEIDRGLKLPLSERYFLGGIGQYQLRGFKARSVGPRRPILQTAFPGASVFTPLGRGGISADDPLLGVCKQEKGCNDITDKKVSDFEVKKDSDVIGGSKFISASFEYRFPILESFGLQGIAFFDTGNAFEEGENLFDVTDWRYGTGGAVQWFSPFGPIMVVLGFPIDRVSELEKAPVFEFSVGGG
jgi:outer membrane protein insertion porin family